MKAWSAHISSVGTDTLGDPWDTESEGAGNEPTATPARRRAAEGSVSQTLPPASGRYPRKRQDHREEGEEASFDSRPTTLTKRQAALAPCQAGHQPTERAYAFPAPVEQTKRRRRDAAPVDQQAEKREEALARRKQLSIKQQKQQHDLTLQRIRGVDTGKAVGQASQPPSIPQTLAQRPVPEAHVRIRSRPGGSTLQMSSQAEFLRMQAALSQPPPAGAPPRLEFQLTLPEGMDTRDLKPGLPLRLQPVPTTVPTSQQVAVLTTSDKHLGCISAHLTASSTAMVRTRKLLSWELTTHATFLKMVITHAFMRAVPTVPADHSPARINAVLVWL
ncbi:hypothetical protein WJX72_003240 [[Myrmecia] bisecta]|uniref:INO80 complex subunit B-like conserved region domain-containing protein n=1 Tax=[Myrmecia] bisecta TaxID=41462 RepID=A0AAW1QQH8_9CHLO